MNAFQSGYARACSGPEQAEVWLQLSLDFGGDCELRPDDREQPLDQQMAVFAEPANDCGKSLISLNLSAG